jgi:ornithine cyclodeaminase
MTQTPIIKGKLLKDGAHLDLIGAFRPDMREADDDALTRGRVFVDCFDTTIDEIGEIKIPIERGTITRDDVLADFYGLATGSFGRDDDAEITVFKNGGGAHLDILTAAAIASAVT